MYNELNLWIKQLHQRITNDFYLPETQLFYDHYSDKDQSGQGHLPDASEIMREYPNPCGWGTGMEDCALHAGSMIDSLCIMGDFAAASQALHGLLRLVTAHGHNGFVARGLSPLAPNKCYPNSSRDQFTLAVSGAWTIFRSSPFFADRQLAVKILKLISGYCHEKIKPESSYNLLRHDGRHALVSKMWKNNPHECLRLPMIYAATGVAAKDQSKLFLAEELLEEAIIRTLTMDDSRNWWDIELSQLQLSIKLLLECQAFPNFTDKLHKALAKTALLARRELKILVDRAEKFTGNWEVCMSDWRKCDMRDIISSKEDGEIHYKSVIFPSNFYSVTELLRGIGNLLMTICLYGNIPDDELRRLWNILSSINFTRCNSGGIIQLLQGLLKVLLVKYPESINFNKQQCLVSGNGDQYVTV